MGGKEAILISAPKTMETPPGLSAFPWDGVGGGGGGQPAEGDAEGEDQGRKQHSSFRPKSTQLHLPNLRRKRFALGLSQNVLWVVLHLFKGGGK